MKIFKTKFDEVLVIEPEIFTDERGEFHESYNENKLKSSGVPVYFPLEFQSKSKKGVLRGLHFQKTPFSQGKLIRIIRGKVLDVVLDLRVNSKTYGIWESFLLDDYRENMLWIPEGFAHGFLSLNDDTIMHYKVTKPYNKNAESGVIWNDSLLKIDWKLEEYNIDEIIISEKDRMLPSFNAMEKNNTLSKFSFRDKL
jgi:dTDP-4-dehydrorhamnose 3,5-epimerase